jgi:spore coat polysaccharide biosynthesis protein SpsF
VKRRIVLIGIQARSTSKRLPNKIHMRIGGKSILERVIFSCTSTIRYLKNDLENFHAEIKLCLLAPKGDPAVAIYKNQIPILEGDEFDVLSRYVQAAKDFDADFIVRITADCFFLPTHLISKHIKSALIKNRDYTTNVHLRTYMEGLDVEVLSRRLLDWIDLNAETPYDREHVTTLIGPDKPFPFPDMNGNKNICHVINYLDQSHIKTSIDTKEDFEKAKMLDDKFEETKKLCVRQGIFVS